MTWLKLLNFFRIYKANKDDWCLRCNGEDDQCPEFDCHSRRSQYLHGVIVHDSAFERREAKLGHPRSNAEIRRVLKYWAKIP